MKKISIKQLAEELQVSRNTITKAFLDHDTVSTSTKERIIQRALALGYAPINPALIEKYALGQSQQENIIILAHREASVFWDAIALSIFDCIASTSYKLLYHFVSYEDDLAGIIPEVISEKTTYGVIFLNVFSDLFLEHYKQYQLPTVFLDTTVNVDNSLYQGDIVYIEGKKQVFDITQKLIHQGKKQIGFIGDISYCKTLSDRYQGYQEAMTTHGIAQLPELVHIESIPTRYYHLEVLGELMKQWPVIPDAIVCVNDSVANLLQFLCEKDSRFENTEITGFDNHQDTALFYPEMTTVGVDKKAIGIVLANKLMNRMRYPLLPFEISYLRTEIKIGIGVKEKEYK